MRTHSHRTFTTSTFWTIINLNKFCNFDRIFPLRYGKNRPATPPTVNVAARNRTRIGQTGMFYWRDQENLTVDGKSSIHWKYKSTFITTQKYPGILRGFSIYILTITNKIHCFHLVRFEYSEYYYNPRKHFIWYI